MFHCTVIPFPYLITLIDTKETISRLVVNHQAIPKGVHGKATRVLDLYI